MIDTLLWIALGAFIGWNFPQPFWAKLVQARVEKWWEDFNSKK